MKPLVLYAARPDSVPVIRCSPPSLAAQIALIELDVPHEIRLLCFDRQEHKSESMLALSPAGTLPVLVDGRDVLTVTAAILKRIELGSRHRESCAEAFETALALKDAGMRTLVALMKSGPGPASIEAWRALDEPLARWEARLEVESDRRWCDRFDIASALAWAYLATVRSLGFQLDAWPNAEAFWLSACNRASVRDAWPSTWSDPPGG